MNPYTLETMKTEVLAALDAVNLRDPSWQEWAESTRAADPNALSSIAAALLRERDAFATALERLAAEIPALKTAFERKTTPQERLEFLCGAFLLSYRMTPKRRLEVKNAQQGGAPWVED